MTQDKPDGQLKAKICQIFELAKQPAGHQSLVKKAKDLYNKSDIVNWNTNFLNALKYCFVYNDKTAADQMLRFVAKFASSLYSQGADLEESEDTSEEDHPFISAVFRFLFETHSASLIDARLRCTTLINFILSALPEESCLPVTIWNGLVETIRTRLQDKNTTVRVAAVLVARKLQEPKNPKCEIVRLLMFHLTDPAPAVRRAVLSSIALSKLTLPEVLDRTLDVNENVRRNAFAVVAKVRYTIWTISQRIAIIQRGLKDRAERVNSCVEKLLLPQWLEHVDHDLIKLLGGWDVVNCSEVALLGLTALSKSIPFEDILKHLPLDETTHLVPADTLTPELALLWRFLVFQAKEHSMHNFLDALLPNVSSFVSFIESWNSNILDSSSTSDEDQWTVAQRKRVLVHLLEICTHLDLTDEVGRANLKKMSINMLTSPATGCAVVPNLVEILNFSLRADGTFMRTILETISEIREPLCQVESVEPSNKERMANEVLASKMKMALYNLKDEEEAAVSSKNYAEAAEIAAKINELTAQIQSMTTQPENVILTENREQRTDPETVCKCLKILMKAVEISGIKLLTPELRSLVEFITTGLESNDLLTQSLSIQALAQFCILDSTLAQTYLCSFVFMLSENGYNEVNIPALRAIFDIIHIHGATFLENMPATAGDELLDETTNRNDSNMYDDDFPCQPMNRGNNNPAYKCLAVLKALLKTAKNEDLKRTVFEGFCKLLATGVIYSPSLLRTVIIKGFSPIQGNESEDRIRQFFMVFFPVFARHTQRSQEMIEASFIPVMRELKGADMGTAEADTNSRDVASFLIEYTKPDTNSFTAATVHVHNNLALSICHEILRETASDLECDHNYLRCLTQLNLSLESEAYASQLAALVAKIKRDVRETTGLRLVKQLQDKLLVSSSASVQNTFESTNHQSRTSSSTKPDFSIGSRVTLEEVTEEDDGDYTIENNSSSSQRKESCGVPLGLVIPESPEISD